MANKTPHEENLCNYLGIKKDDLPTSRILDSSSGDMITYKLDGGVNQDDLEKFIENWKEGKLNPEILSLTVPKEQDRPYYVLVGRTFDQFVYDTTKDVAVLFTAEKEFCPICEPAEVAYEDAATRLKGNPNLLVAFIDLKKNSIRNHPNINKFPSIYLWKASDKSKPIKYEDSQSNPDQIIKFLRKYSRHQIKDTKEEEEKQKEKELEDQKDEF